MFSEFYSIISALHVRCVFYFHGNIQVIKIKQVMKIIEYVPHVMPYQRRCKKFDFTFLFNLFF